MRTVARDHSKISRGAGPTLREPTKREKQAPGSSRSVFRYRPVNSWWCGLSASIWRICSSASCVSGCCLSAWARVQFVGSSSSPSKYWPQKQSSAHFVRSPRPIFAPGRPSRRSTPRGSWGGQERNGGPGGRRRLGTRSSDSQASSKGADRAARPFFRLVLAAATWRTSRGSRALRPPRPRDRREQREVTKPSRWPQPTAGSSARTPRPSRARPRTRCPRARSRRPRKRTAGTPGCC
jgi:hypothetical protein